MGLSVSIYKSDLGSCSNGGVSATADNAVIVNVEGGPFTPGPDRPALMLVPGVFGHQGQIIAVPAVIDDATGEWVPARHAPGNPDASTGPMMGGCHVGTSDSRFGEAVAKLGGNRWGGTVALHDRYETPAQYASYD